MSKMIDLTDQVFGRLTVKSRAENKGSQTFWNCLCECGKQVPVNAYHLRTGRTQSCGCNRKGKPVTDLTDKVFGRLTVKSLSNQRTNQGGARWKCDCECGNPTVVAAGNLTSGAVRSCGCLAKEAQKTNGKVNNTTHGKSGTSEYNIWHGMKQRCLNPKNKGFPNYGGRGITVCDRWINSFENFYEDMGPRPSLEHSIDRKENNGNYEPGNCHWTTEE